MPVRSLRSPVLRWPDRDTVVRSLLGWLEVEASRHPGLLRFGYFGSYARGDWGVGSDLDLVAIVSAADERFDRRAVSWSTEELPVPTDLIVYTEAEWRALAREGNRFVRTLESEAVWVWAEERRPLTTRRSVQER